VIQEDQYRNPVLQIYRKDEDLIFKAIPIPNLLMVEFRRIFGQPTDDPMCEVYPVSEEQVKQIQSYTSEIIDLANFEYFVICFAELRGGKQ
jgi:hypothetical protein